MSGLAACLGLFSSALIASTLFPAQSRLVLAGLLIAGIVAICTRNGSAPSCPRCYPTA